MNAKAQGDALQATSLVVPAKLAHVVLRAKHWSEMLAWYRTVFHMRTSFEAPVIAFLTYDEEHHRIAFLNTAHLPAPDQMRTGVDHIAFTYESLGDLLSTWKRLKAEGITPFWCINHGPTTSMYFRDPDGNELELQADNFLTMEEATAWFSSTAFAENPIGQDFDPELLYELHQRGVPDHILCSIGSAPVAAGKAYQYTTLPPPPMEPAAPDPHADIRRDIEELCRCYSRAADLRQGEELASLFVENGVFVRLGQRFVGRAEIAGVINSRPPDLWTHHTAKLQKLDVDADGLHASGVLSATAQKGRPGSEVIERLDAVFHDRYTRTASGWKIEERIAVAAS